MPEQTPHTPPRRLVIALVIGCAALVISSRFGWLDSESSVDRRALPLARPPVFIKVRFEEPASLWVGLDATQFDAVALRDIRPVTPVAISFRMSSTYNVQLDTADRPDVRPESYVLELHTGPLTDGLAELLKRVIVPVRLLEADRQLVASGHSVRLVYYLSETSSADSAPEQTAEQPTTELRPNPLVDVRILPPVDENGEPRDAAPEAVERWIAVASPE